MAGATFRTRTLPSAVGGRARVGDAAEYVGSYLAGTEAADRVGAHQRGAGCANAAGSRTLDALELPDGAHFVRAVVPDSVLHGSGEPLPVPEYRRAIKLAEGFHDWRHELQLTDD